MKKHFLDTRDLEPPEPFAQASSVLRALQPTEFLLFRHRRKPFPLFDFSKTIGIEYQVCKETADDITIIFFFKQDYDALVSDNIL